MINCGSDTDHPVYSDKRITRRAGTDSFDVVVFGNESSTVLLGGTTCQMGQTGFWLHKNESNEKYLSFDLSLSFGLHSKDNASVLSEVFTCLCTSVGDDANSVLERYGEKCQDGQDKDSKMASPLRDLNRAPIGFGSWYQFYHKVTSDDMDRVIKVIESQEQLQKTIDVIQLDGMCITLTSVLFIRCL